jgi:hypothetical protein
MMPKPDAKQGGSQMSTKDQLNALEQRVDKDLDRALGMIENVRITNLKGADVDLCLTELRVIISRLEALGEKLNRYKKELS